MISLGRLLISTLTFFSQLCVLTSNVSIVFFVSFHCISVSNLNLSNLCLSTQLAHVKLILNLRTRSTDTDTDTGHDTDTNTSTPIIL
jgi:hypothetical protein